MPIKNLVADARQRMHTSVETVRRELATMRTGRASLSMLDGIKVDYYGTSRRGIPSCCPSSRRPSGARTST